MEQRTEEQEICPGKWDASVPFAAPNPSAYLVVVSLSLALFSEGGKGKLSPHLVLILVIYIMAMASWGCKEGERESERTTNLYLWICEWISSLLFSLSWVLWLTVYVCGFVGRQWCLVGVPSLA